MKKKHENKFRSLMYILENVSCVIVPLREINFYLLYIFHTAIVTQVEINFMRKEIIL